ncbi:MAG: hypothetical protein Q8Q26_00280 [Pseudorhodobacter sp.]|nr:hypothetical protein [Pseudorhodobacter sp.]
MEIEKAYFTLAEILDRWPISEADLIYLAENDKLRLSVRVFGLKIEFGDYEITDDARRYRIPVCKIACKSDQLTGWNSVQN